MNRLPSPLLPAALALALGSCSEPLAPPTPGPLLFEVETEGVSIILWRGYSIDAEGGVYAWDATGSVPPEGDVFTADQLAAKYARHRVQVASLTPAEVETRYAAAAPARRGRLTAARPACPDFAIERFYLLVYDPAGDRYTRVLLHERGGAGRANRASAARAAYHWLAQAIGEAVVTGPDSCDPYG